MGGWFSSEPKPKPKPRPNEGPGTHRLKNRDEGPEDLVGENNPGVAKGPNIQPPR